MFVHFIIKRLDWYKEYFKCYQDNEQIMFTLKIKTNILKEFKMI